MGAGDRCSASRTILDQLFTNRFAFETEQDESQIMNLNRPTTALDLSASQRLTLARQASEALRRDPKNIDALLTLAGIHGAENNFTAAIGELKKALALRKKDIGILARLVSACNDAGDLAMARKYARKLTEVAPRDPENHKKYGLILELQGFPQHAIEAYRKADRLQPGNRQTLHDIGRNYASLGDETRALEFYEKALNVDPTYALALYSYAVARKFTPDEVDDFLDKVESSLPTTADDPVLRANLHYAAAKALEDTGRHDEAFAHFHQANALRQPDDEASIVTPFLNTLDALTRDFMRSREGAGLETTQPIFILGMPRSGTTLTESLCGAHSKVTAGDERTVLTSMARRLGCENGTAGAYGRNLEQLSKQNIRGLAEDYLARCKAIAGTTPHFTDKLPHNFMHVGLIALLFPNAKIIHCRRHPLDNCLSLYSNSLQPYHNRYKTDLTRLGMYYRQYLRLMEHWRQILPGKMHEVFYEDLVANTEWNARAIIEYLELEWEDGVLDRTSSQRSVRTASNWQVRQPVYQSSKGKWRYYEKHLEPLIEALGPGVEAYERELAALATSHTEAS